MTEYKEQPGKRSLKEAILPLLLVLSVCAFPSMLLYGGNGELMRFSEIAGHMLLFMGIGFALYALLLLTPWSAAFCGAFVSVVMLFAVKFLWLTNLVRVIPSLSASMVNILSFVLYAVIVAVAWVLIRLCSRKVKVFPQLVSVLAITLFGLVLLNGVMGAAGQLGLGKTAQATAPSPTAQVEAVVETTVCPTPLPEATSTGVPTSTPEVPLLESKPNIYLLIMDELGRTDMVQQFYQFDNTPFDSALTEMGFSVSSSSYCNSTHTFVCLADIMRLDNECSIQKLSGSLSRDIAQNGALLTELTALGYEPVLVATGGGSFFRGIPFLNARVGVDREMETGDGETASEYIAGQSILSALFGPDRQEDVAGLSQTMLTPEDILASDNYRNAPSWVQEAVYNLMSVIQFYVSPANYEAIDGPRLTLSYIKCPHVPFCLDENGNVTSTGVTSNWSDLAGYLGQYRYITAQLQIIAATILEYDPNSIIIIQSDHGIRDHRSGTYPAPYAVSFHEATAIYNAVYLGGRPIDIEGLSPVNTLRLVLSEFGLDYPQIDDPSK